MTDTAAVPLRKTPLNARHRAANARMVAFAGWDMPVEYSGIVNEHLAVRTRAGVFDVSHMGEIEIAGKDALAAVQRISCNDASRLQVGQAQYTGLLSAEGTFLDDMIVYRMAPSHFLLVVNASNAGKDFAWISAQIGAAGEAVAVDTSSRYSLIAVQGPAALEVVQPLTGADLSSLRPFWFTYGEVAGARVTIARTGYTGEDGVEIFVPPNMAERVWLALLESGRSVDILPIGLGARDTLRLEAALRLHGSDIDESTTPIEAGLGWIIGRDKTAYIGRDRIQEQVAKGVTRKLVGFEMVERAIARHGHPVMHAGKTVGTVTSGTQTPFLKKAIGMAYVPPALADAGSELDIDIRGRVAKARVVPMPFYKKPKR